MIAPRVRAILVSAIAAVLLLLNLPVLWRGEPLLYLAWVAAAAGSAIYCVAALRAARPGGGILLDVGYAIWAVSLIVLASFSVSATWPVMVAVESGSMEPNVHQGDLVFILGLERTSIVTWRDGESRNYGSFGLSKDSIGRAVYGDVIVYKPNGDGGRTPIIHRAVRWINRSELMPVRDGAPPPMGRFAPHDGYLTLGDNNVGSFDPLPVKPEWIIGVARFRVPLLGCVRLLLSGSLNCGVPRGR